VVHILQPETKSITLAFMHQAGGAGFSRLTVFLIFGLLVHLRATCDLNQKASPSPSTVWLAELALLNLFFLSEIRMLSP
jgi:hypothetical protein